MDWYWIALICGLIAPLFVFGGQISLAFREGGIRTGLGTWFGMSLITIPIMFLIIGIGGLFH